MSSQPTPPDDPDATRHEGLLDPDATRHEGSATGVLPRFGYLPPRLASRFEWLSTLSTAGGQADVLLCRDRSSGTEVAVKVYRGGATIDHATYDKVQQVDAAHVAPILELWDEPGEKWEVQEYFPRGSLHDLLGRRGRGPQATEFVRAVLVELSEALRVVHAKGIVHRDLKPGNVFVRTEEPLDLVLGDFGYARDLSMSSEYMSVVGVFHYTAPEAVLSGQTSPHADWWSLGVIVYELLTGHSLFRDAQGAREANPYRVRGALHEGAYSVSDATDARWNLLLRGLLHPDRTHRWDERQVGSWLSGGSPQVVAPEPTSSPAGAGPFALPWGRFDDPADVTASLVARWTDACDYLSGQDATHLRMWLARTRMGDAADPILREVRDGGLSAGAGLVLLQLVVSPTRRVVFRDRGIDGASLAETARAAASGDKTAQEWIRALRSEQVLAAVAAHTDEGSRYAAADLRLRQHWRRLDEVLAEAGHVAGVRELAGPITGPLEGTVLSVSLDDTQAEARLADGRATAARLAVGDASLLHALADRTKRGSVPDALALTLLGTAVVEAREAAARAAAAQRARAEEERAAQERQAALQRERDAAERREREAREEAARKAREFRGRVKVAGRRLVGRVVLTGILYGVAALYRIGFSSRDWVTLLIGYVPVPLLCLAAAFVVEVVVSVPPPRLAYSVGLVVLAWQALGQLRIVTAAPAAADPGQWLASLTPWFLGGYVVGYGGHFLLTRRGSRGYGGVEARWHALPVLAFAAVAVQRVEWGFAQVGTDIGMAGLGWGVARAVMIPVIRDLPYGAMQILALVTAAVSLIALSTPEFPQLLREAERVFWAVVNVAAALVVAFYLPLLVGALGVLILVLIAAGLAELGIAMVTGS